MTKHHINGWPEIAARLRERHCKQIDLARLLDITPSAISQIKGEEFQLNSRQIARICRFLQFDDKSMERFLNAVVNARLPGLRLQVQVRRADSSPPSDNPPDQP